MASIDILIPTYNRADALAVTLTGLAMQSDLEFDVTVADQSDVAVAYDPTVANAVRLLKLRGCSVTVFRNLPRLGLAHQRQVLLDHATAPLVLYLDDDLTLEPWVVGQLRAAIGREQCGFVGSPCIGLSYIDDIRPHEQAIAWWDGPVTPERIERDGPGWDRYRLHNAANPLHVQRALGLTPATNRLYKVAWVGGCVMYDTAKLRAVGGFEFWRDLPPAHAGEDVVAQLRVMAQYGGAGVLPSGVYHQELPTTVPDRDVDAPKVLVVHTANDSRRLDMVVGQP